MSETLYNGIKLPEEWPPKDINPYDFQPMRVPYLSNPPDVIDITIGRQLFCDDFLYDECGMTPMFHRPVKYNGNPLFVPTTKYERNEELPSATVPKCGGIWHDPADGLFKMWYMASYFGNMAYATSRDGVHWERPELDVVAGSNLVLPLDIHLDSGTVWLDKETTDELQRFKMLIREPNRPENGHFPALMFTSADGIHWSKPVQTGDMDDRSTMFYNPFRRKWVQSIRSWISPRRNRCRLYWEDDDFLQSGRWQEGQPVYWTGADIMDRSRYTFPELYNLDANAYESVMLGFYQILQGPPNQICERAAEPKLTELVLATSRDGFHFFRPDRTPFIGARREPDSWEYGYVEPTGGIALLVGDEMWFYYSAYGGDPSRAGLHWSVNGMCGNGALGLAKLRRDGFASLRSTVENAWVRTRKLRFTEGKGLYVNANTSGELLTVEVQDESCHPLPGFTHADCVGFRGNSTCAEIRWREADFANLKGRPFRLCFKMGRGDLYSFWTDKNGKGASGGYVAAGGPAFSGSRDM